MKELFKGFYTPSEKDIKKSWSDEKTLFVFDTNVLLNLYRYTEATRDDFFQIIDSISEKIWLPYHVGLEYQRNRLTVIKNEKAIFNNLHSYLKDLKKNIETTNLQELKLNQRLPELDKKTKKMQEDINKLIANYKKEIDTWNKKQPDVRSTDKIRKTIDKVFNKKIGSPPENQKWLDDLYKDGEKRYLLNVPPGYMDKKDKENKDNFLYADLKYIPMYGDLIIWKQVIEKVKNEDIDSLIFVTDDVKEDWWYILNSNGKKEIGARAELRDEIYRNSGIKSFELLRTTDFMKNGQEILKLSVKDESINEAKINFEDKQIKYNQKLKKKILEQFEELNTNNSIFFNDSVQDYIKDKNRKNKLELGSEWLNILDNNKNTLASKTLQDKLEAFEKPYHESTYSTLLKAIEKEEILNKETKIEKLLKELGISKKD